MLHVDDDPGVRRAVERTLSAAGFSVTGAADGEEGLAAAQRSRFALVILDVELPGLSGFEVCERLRAEAATRHVPVLHLSGARVDVRDRVRGLEGGADAYLVQPVAPEELVAVARALVARGAQGRASRAAPRASRRAAAAREDAIRVAAHLLRGPLSGVAINASSLAASADDPVSRARATALVEAHAHAVQVLADLAELAYLDSEHVVLPLEPLAPADVVAGAVRRAGRAAEQAGVAVEVGDAPPQAPIRCDPQRLERALEILIRRGVRGAHRGGVVRVEAAPDGASVRFSVQRAGAPDGEDVRDLLETDAWSARLPRSAADLVELRLARAVALAHRGRIWLDPERGAIHLAVPASPFAER